LSDKPRAISLLQQAQQSAPGDPELAAHIRYLYALAILGVDMINHNGLPSASAVDARGYFAPQLRSELTTSSDARVVGNAGWIIGRYGLILGGMLRDKFAVDYFPLAEELLSHAQQARLQGPDMSRRVGTAPQAARRDSAARIERDVSAQTKERAAFGPTPVGGHTAGRDLLTAYRPLCTRSCSLTATPHQERRNG
jgi:hypothetical protein